MLKGLGLQKVNKEIIHLGICSNFNKKRKRGGGRENFALTNVVQEGGKGGGGVEKSMREKKG